MLFFLYGLAVGFFVGLAPGLAVGADHDNYSATATALTLMILAFMLLGHGVIEWMR